jgi:arylsulfatase A-like enzyme
MRTKYFLLGLVSTSVLPVAAQQTKPNVIYILMDDLGYGDVGCFGQDKIETPNINVLRQVGMMFTQHYSGSPVSAPARCVLMTGMHSGHSQIRFNNELAYRGDISNYDSMYVHRELEGQAPLKAGTMTIARLMQQAGYKTGCFGKWGLGYPGSEGVPNKQGFDEFYGYNCQRQAHTYYPAFLYHNEERVYLKNRIVDPHREAIDKGADIYDPKSFDKLEGEEYSNDLIFDAMMNFVDEYGGKNPFFLYWSTPIPHVSLQAPKSWVNYYVQKFGDEKPYLSEAGYLPCRYPHATYAAMISYFDDQIGKLVSKLKSEGLYENTLIIFTSDNGPTFNGGSDSVWFDSGGPFKSEYGWGKCFLHEGGIRVPAVMVWKDKIQAGSLTEHLTSFQDVMPTLSELTNTVCPTTDGISFLPTILGHPDQQKEHEFLYWEYPDSQVGNRAIRKGKWKGLIEHIVQGNTKMQLFNLEEDLQELHDVADEYPEIVADLQRLMDLSHE